MTPFAFALLLLSGCWHHLPESRCVTLCGGTLDTAGKDVSACVCVEGGR